MRYDITEIFSSIQGEGYWTGALVTFIRFAGCNMRCPFCDTDHTRKMSLEPIDILERVEAAGNQRIVFTGGEPLLQLQQDGDPLLRVLKDRQYICHVETNGTVPISFPLYQQLDWITVSPKGKLEVFSGGELKVLNLPGVDLDAYWDDTDFTAYYLQPVWEGNGCDVNAAIDVLRRHPKWRLSLQAHKFIGVQ